MIYFLRVRADEIVMVPLYAKNVQDNIDPGLLRQLRQQYEKNRKP